MDKKGKKEFKKQLRTKGKKFKKRFLKFVIFQSKKKKKKYPTCVSSDTHLYSLCPESKDMVSAGMFLIADE